MTGTSTLLRRIWTSRRGVTAVEYAVVTAGVVAAAAIAFAALGTRLASTIANALVGP